MASVFLEADPYPGANPFTRRSLSKLNLKSAVVRKLLAAIEILGIRAKSPYYREDCFAHIGLPNLCVAISTRTQSNPAFTEAQKERWAKYKHKSFVVAERALERMSVEDVAKQLSEALKAVGKRV